MGREWTGKERHHHFESCSMDSTLSGSTSSVTTISDIVR